MSLSSIVDVDDEVGRSFSFAFCAFFFARFFSAANLALVSAIPISDDTVSVDVDDVDDTLFVDVDDDKMDDGMVDAAVAGAFVSRTDAAAATAAVGVAVAVAVAGVGVDGAVDVRLGRSSTPLR